MNADWFAAAAGGAVCVVNARVIDGLDHAPIDDGFVLIEEGKVGQVASMARLGPARSHGPRRVDVEGRTLLPGLIDCHAHLVYAAARGTPRARAGRLVQEGR